LLLSFTSRKYTVIIELYSAMNWILAPYFKVQCYFEKKIIETG
jgi:hypothetical protein